MGLAGRREKQRIPNDPRNLSWADNATKFGQAYLSKLGWDSSKGLGVEGDGRTSHIKVSQKLDMLGIGAANSKDVNGIAWKQNKEFEELLKRLNEGAEKPVGVDQAEEGGGDRKKRKKDNIGDDGKKKKKLKEKSAEDSTSRKRNKTEPTCRDTPQVVVPETTLTTSIAAPRPAHRARFIASKNLASKSASAISEILGIAPTPSSASPLPSTSSSTPSQGALTQLDENHALEKLTTSTKSVADYFKERLIAKAAATVSLPSNGNESGEDDMPRGGLGSSKLRLEHMEEQSAPSRGLGMSTFGSLMSGAFLDSLPHSSAVTGRDVMAGITGSLNPEDGIGTAEQERKKKGGEKSKRGKKKNSSERDGSSEDAEERRRERKARKERRRQGNTKTDVTQEKITTHGGAHIPSFEEAQNKVETKEAKKARRDA